MKKSLKFHLLVGSALAVFLTALSFVVAFAAQWITEVNPVEVAAVVTSYLCTYLCVMQRRFNYIVALVTTSLYCYLFWQWELFASMATQIYLIPTVIIGWFWWKSDKNPRPVTHTSLLWWVGVASAAFFIYGGAVLVSIALGGTLPFWDSAILVGTIAAQFLMDRKKLENWIVWGVVNVIAIGVYFSNGLYLAAFQYVFFLANAVWAYVEWRKTLKPEVPEVFPNYHVAY